ncbi:histone-lysine N-methyltransferase SETMAR [Trichonephila clavipes]|nr:histone-lysine N-methyltransferase SETMAR [Trichonephila clavipes]
MDVSKELVRLLYDFKVGLSAAALSLGICQAFGAVNEPRTGRPQALDDEVLQAVIEENSSQTCGEHTRQFNTSSETVILHLHRLGKTYRCIHIQSVLTSYEKWVLYGTPKRSKHLSSPEDTVPHSARPPMHPRKIMLCVWWTCRQVVHYELLPKGQMVIADIYSQQLEHVHPALNQKELALVNQKGVLLLHDNARPHVARVARNTIQRLGLETLCHPLYSPDLAPSNYHLFHYLDNHLRGKSFTNEAELRKALADIFAPPPPSFTARGLNNWRHVGRRCWMLMVITSRTNNKLRCLYVMFFWVIKNG